MFSSSSTARTSSSGRWSTRRAGIRQAEAGLKREWEAGVSVESTKTRPKGGRPPKGDVSRRDVVERNFGGGLKNPGAGRRSLALGGM